VEEIREAIKHTNPKCAEAFKRGDVAAVVAALYTTAADIWNMNASA
jgi:hypothetical protein